VSTTGQGTLKGKFQCCTVLKFSDAWFEASTYKAYSAWRGIRNFLKVSLTPGFVPDTVYLTTLFSNSDYIASNERVKSELERVWKEAAVA
jgi:hypothetical protein